MQSAFSGTKIAGFSKRFLSFRACGRTMMSYVIPGLSLDFAFLQNGRKQFEYVKYEYILFGKRSENIRTTERSKADFLLILRKAWLQGLANDWKNICFHK